MAWQCARSQRISIESYVRRRLERRRQLITRPPQTQLVNLPCAILPEGPFYFPFHLSFFYERPRAPLPIHRQQTAAYIVCQTSRRDSRKSIVQERFTE